MTAETVIFREVERIAPDLVAAFQGLDVATVHEGMAEDALLDHRLAPVVAGARICGPAVTAHNAPGDNLAMHVALDTTRPGDVLVVAAGSEAPIATWGGMATIAACGRGLAAVVTDGYARDVEVIRDQGLPVWSRGISPLRATKEAIQGVNVPIVCGGVAVAPGDLVIADDDGVVVVPPTVAREVLERALDRRNREAADAAVLAQGTSPFAFHGMSAALDRAALTVAEGSFAGQASR